MSRSKNDTFWNKTKNFFTSLLASNKTPVYPNKTQKDEDDQSGSTGSQGSQGRGDGKPKGQGFIDPKAATHVKDPETILYNELKKDPAAMLALKKLTNGQIPSSELAAEFELVRNSDVALQTIAKSPYAPFDIRSRAQYELDLKKLKKLEAEQALNPSPSRPGSGMKK